MANIRRWMAEARALEEAGDLRGAIALHQKALAAQEETTGFADLGLHNGLGDLYLRSADTSRAVGAFEKAVEVCEEQQLYANGIALCKKILRNAPGHAEAHRRAGRLLAASGLHAEARVHYEEYVDLSDRAGRPERATAALEELVSLTADEVGCLTLADRLIQEGRTDAALPMLRATRERREEDGRDVVAIVRRIQELHQVAGGATAAPSPPAETSSPATAGSARGPSPSPPRPGNAARPDVAAGAEARAEEKDEVASLMSELEEVLSGLDAPERYRHALPILDQLLQFHSERFDLLHRKLAYAFALGDEATTVETYLALGQLLDRRLHGFSIRSLCTSPPSGQVTTALKVAPRPEEAGTGS